MHTHPNARVGNVGERIAGHLDAIRAMFKPGVVVTLVVRAGGEEGHGKDMIMTSDKPEKVIAALQHHQTAKDTQHAQVMSED
jgi:hypothetical protein